MIDKSIEQDCSNLNEVLKKEKIDEEYLMDLVINRTIEQRTEIRKKYLSSFGIDLIQELKSKLRGDFENSIVGCFMNHTEFDSYMLYKAMARIGTYEGVLTEIIGSRDNNELTEIKKEFEKTYGKSLEEWIESETSGAFKNLLISLLQCNRKEDKNDSQIDEAACKKDAEALYKAGEGRIGTDEPTFNKIFALRSPKEVVCICNCYKQIYNRSLLEAIGKEYSGDIKELLITVIKCCFNKGKYFASRINESVKGKGTNDSRLIRVVVSRAGVDMSSIKKEYRILFGKDMLVDVRNDISGNYKSIITYLITKSS